MNIPKNLMYTKTHEWVEAVNDTTVRVGLTAYAAEQLGDLVFINLPEVGDEAVTEEVLCDVESVKAVSDIYSPATGKITAVNEELMDAPQNVNAEPFTAWIAEIGDITEKIELLNSDEYEKILAEEA